MGQDATRAVLARHLLSMGRLDVTACRRVACTCRRQRLRWTHHRSCDDAFVFLSSVSSISFSRLQLFTGRAVINSFISGAAAVFVTVSLVRYKTEHYDLVSALNSVLAGLVSISAGSAFMDAWAALIVGATGAVIYNFGIWVVYKLQLDDPVSMRTTSLPRRLYPSLSTSPSLTPV